MYIDNKVLEQLIQDSRINGRKRSHVLLHNKTEDTIQSLLFALQPSTKIGVHRHFNPTETICCLKGSMAVIMYDEKGNISSVRKLNINNPVFKFRPSRWHSYICLSEDTIGWEIKEGPYKLENFQSPEWCPDVDSVEFESLIMKVKEYVRNI